MPSPEPQQRPTDQGVIPMVACEEGCAAFDWLARAFGFVDKVGTARDGLLVHREMHVPV